MLSLSFDPVGKRLAYLLTIIRKDGTTIRATNYSQNIVVSGHTWTATPGLEIGDQTFANDGTLSVMSFKVAASPNGTFDPYEIDLAMFEDADVSLYLIDTASPSTSDQMFYGKTKGSVDYDAYGNASFEIVSKFGAMRDIFIRQYTIEDDVDFGDPRRSKIPTFPTIDITSTDLRDLQRNETVLLGDRRRFRFASAGNPSDYHNVYLEATAITTGMTAATTPTPSSTVATTYVDGGVTWTTRNAWARSFQVASLIDSQHVTITVTEPRATDVTWFAPGKVVFRSGFCTGLVSDVDAWDGTSQIEIVSPLGTLLNVGDWGEIAPDYDQTLDMAVNKYNNANNYRGFPHLTGAALAASTFVAGTTVTPGPIDDPGSDDGGSVEFAGGSG